jgi:hypothetical protein
LPPSNAATAAGPSIRATLWLHRGSPDLRQTVGPTRFSQIQGPDAHLSRLRAPG